MPDKPLTPQEEDVNHTLVKHVRPWLKSRGSNQAALADHLGVSEATVSKWLTGKQSMSIGQFAQIAAFLKCEPAEMMGAPDESQRSLRYQRLAEQIQTLPDEQLDALTVIAGSLAQKPPRAADLTARPAGDTMPPRDACHFPTPHRPFASRS